MMEEFVVAQDGPELAVRLEGAWRIRKVYEGQLTAKRTLIVYPKLDGMRKWRGQRNIKLFKVLKFSSLSENFGKIDDLELLAD